jgi:hypothetical protein
MFSATVYIVVCTAKNRVQRRLRRLREPRYLIGAIVGIAYIGFAVVGRMIGMSRGSRRRRERAAPAALMPAFGATGPSLAGLFMLTLASLSWLTPLSTSPLTFTPAEKALLFSAPISRRQLLLYRILRAQWSSLFGAAIFAIAYPVASAPARLRGLAAGWIALMTFHLFLSGTLLARLRLRSMPAPVPGHAAAASASTRARALFWLPQLLTVGALAVVAVEFALAARTHPVQTPRDMFEVVRAVIEGGLTPVVLTPFIAVVRPLFATSLASFMVTMIPALLVYAAVLAWVLSGEDVVDILAERSAEEPESPVDRDAVAYRARTASWTLALTGRPEGLFVWKGAQQTFRMVDRRAVLQFFAVVAWIAVFVVLIGQLRGGALARALAALATVAAALVTVIGPQVFRRDMRQDLAKLDVLQTWPIRPASVVRGEILWPAAVVTVVAWVLGVVALILSASLFSRANVSMRVAAGTAALIFVPALVLAQYTIHNAAALIFPGWIPADGSRPRGVDALGQRLILFGGTFAVLMVSLLPPAIVSGTLWLVVYPIAGVWALVPISGLAAAIVLGEVFIATEALGPAYESLDMTSVERIE